METNYAEKYPVGYNQEEKPYKERELDLEWKPFIDKLNDNIGEK